MTVATQVEHAGSIELLDGTFVRFGPDEASEFDVPLSVSFDTEMPGGFSAANVVLPRPSDFDPLSAKLFAAVRLYDARSNQTLYEGRVVGAPMDAQAVTLECEGWIKALEDDQTCRFLGIDRDFSKWEGPSITYQIEDVQINFSPEGPELTADPATGNAAMLLQCDGDFTSASNPDIVGIFNGQGLNIGAIDYAWLIVDPGIMSSASWVWMVILGEDDLAAFGSGGHNDTGDLQTGGTSGSGTLTATGKRKVAMAEFYWSSGTPITVYPNIQFGVYWTLLGVIGDHGLPLKGSVAAPNTGRGLLVSDMVAHLVGSYAPVLNYTTGTNGSISPTSFAVPHASWLEDTTARSIIDELALYGGVDLYPLDLFVYDDRTLYLQPTTQYGNTWHVRRDDATTESSEGPDSARQVNGVKVSYDDGTGTTRTVGPVGSTSDIETDTLADNDPSLPANQDGQRHWISFQAGITSDNGAILIGQMILHNRNIEAWRGTVTISGEVRNDAGVWYPAASVRAGDYIVVDDDPDTRPRKVVNTNYQDQTVNASVGAQPDHLDSLLSRIGIVLQGKL